MLLRHGVRRVASATQLAVQSSRLLDGRRPLIQPHDLRPKGVVDMLTGKPVQSFNDSLGVELPHVDLTDDFDYDDIEALKQACDEAGGIVVFTNQKPEMTVHDHVRFARSVADHDNTCLEPHGVAAGHKDAPEMLEIVREANAGVVFGENWHSDFSFHDESASYSILRGAEVPRLGVNDTLFSSVEDAWDALPLLSLEPPLLEAAISRYGRAIAQAERGLPTNSVVPRLKERLEQTKGLLPVLVSLRNPHLKASHFEKLDAALPHLRSPLPRGDELTVGVAVAAQLPQHNAAVQRVSYDATQEAALLEMLHKVRDQWASTEFVVRPFKDAKDTCVLGGVGETPSPSLASPHLLPPSPALSRPLPGACSARSTLDCLLITC